MENEREKNIIINRLLFVSKVFRIRNEKSRERIGKRKREKHHHHQSSSSSSTFASQTVSTKATTAENNAERDDDDDDDDDDEEEERRRRNNVGARGNVKGDLVIDVFASESPKSLAELSQTLQVEVLQRYNSSPCREISWCKAGSDEYGARRRVDILHVRERGGRRESRRFFADEIVAEKDQEHALKHDQIGAVSARIFGREIPTNRQFLITTRDSVPDLDGKHTIFGRVVEGLDVLQRINEAYCDENGRPWQNIRIKHHDSFGPPVRGSQRNVEAPDESPKVDRSVPDDRLEDDFDAEAAQEMDEIELEKKTREQEARSRAVVLEMIGDLPDVDAKPPEESLFVCKLNSVTSDEDLEIIFSRFGKVTSCDVIRDRRTGDSLCYAFINFEA